MDWNYHNSWVNAKYLLSWSSQCLSWIRKACQHKKYEMLSVLFWKSLKVMLSCCWNTHSDPSYILGDLLSHDCDWLFEGWDLPITIHHPFSSYYRCCYIIVKLIWRWCLDCILISLVVVSSELSLINSGQHNNYLINLDQLHINEITDVHWFIFHW